MAENKYPESDTGSKSHLWKPDCADFFALDVHLVVVGIHQHGQAMCKRNVSRISPCFGAHRNLASADGPGRQSLHFSVEQISGLQNQRIEGLGRHEIRAFVKQCLPLVQVPVNINISDEVVGKLSQGQGVLDWSASDSHLPDRVARAMCPLPSICLGSASVLAFDFGGAN